MHRVIVRFALVATLVVLVATTSAGWADDAEFVPRAQSPWLTVSADALFLRLDRGTRQPVPLVLAEFEGETRMTTHDLGFQMEPGLRLALNAQLDTQRSVETVYFGLHHWNSARQVAEDNNLSLPGDLGLATQDFFMADRMSLAYQSEIHNVEVNYWRRIGCSQVYLLGGFRFFDLGERFHINSEDGDTGTSDYRVRARNNLYGAQFGGRWEGSFDRLDLDVVGKAGIFGNAADQSTFLGDLDNTVILRDFRTSGSHAAFVGELGFNAKFKLTERLAARAGYHLIWLEGIARAADQLDFSDTPASGSALAFGNGAFLHGASVGLEARW